MSDANGITRCNASPQEMQVLLEGYQRDLAAWWLAEVERDREANLSAARVTVRDAVAQWCDAHGLTYHIIGDITK